MITLYELNTWLDTLEATIFDVKVSASNISRIVNPHNENERKVVSNGYFQQSKKTALFTCTIQLAKLFSPNKNEKRSFIKLFNRIESDYFGLCIQQQLINNNNNNNDEDRFCSKSDVIDNVAKHRNNVNTQSELIDRIIELRDKSFAHSDPKETTAKLTLAEIGYLVELAVSIYNDLYNGFFGITYMFHVNQSWTNAQIIRQLS